MTELSQGGNAPIPSKAATVVIEWAPQAVGGSDVDVSAFLLGANGKVRKDEDFVFYGSKASGCGSVKMSGGGASTRFDVDLDRVPADVEKIAFTATLTRAQWGQAQSLRLSIAGVAGYSMVTAGKSEAAVIVGELYKRNGSWKVRAIGQGFNGGLGPLATSFGVDISDEPAAPPPPAAAPAQPNYPGAFGAPPAAVAPPPAQPAPRLSLSKITLEKSGQSARISLEKSTGEIVINLNWTQPRGLFSSSVDLDLGVFYELKDGSKSCVDGLNFSRGRGGPRHQCTRQGCFVGAPWVWHAGDDRSGAVATGENVFVNPQGFNDLKRVFVYAFIFNGAARWADTDAVVTVKAGPQEIVVNLGRQNDQRTFVALAEITFPGGADISVKKLVSFHGDHEECDRAYGWGLRYTAGSK